jgi:hypothetical protein
MVRMPMTGFVQTTSRALPLRAPEVVDRFFIYALTLKAAGNEVKFRFPIV